MLDGFTCFLIDDDRDDHEIFTLALQDADKNSRCITAIHGKDALQILNADPAFVPDFIFLDLNMPVMNGKQFLTEMKKIPRLSSVPVIIYSTSSYEKDMEETKQLGASHFLIKPSSIDDLAKILSGLFQKQMSAFLLEERI